jgi:hypothetical protein
MAIIENISALDDLSFQRRVIGYTHDIWAATVAVPTRRPVGFGYTVR